MLCEVTQCTGHVLTNGSLHVKSTQKYLTLMDLVETWFLHIISAGSDPEPTQYIKLKLTMG